MLGSFLLLATCAALRTGRAAPSLQGRRRLAAVSMLSFERLTAQNPSLPLLLFLPGIDGTGGAGATQWPRLAPLFECHAMSVSVDDRSSFSDERNHILS